MCGRERENYKEPEKMMMEPEKEAAATAAAAVVEAAAPAAIEVASTSDARFIDDILCRDFPTEQFLFEIFGEADDKLAGVFSENIQELGAGEELEWLSNEDYFPSLETASFPAAEAPAAASSAAHAGVERCILAAGVASFSAPKRPRSKRQRLLRKELFRRQPSSVVKAKVGRSCLHCATEKTPQWRAGPDGPRTLCNACGVRYKSGRLMPEYRPANSPTFSPSLHSNSHRRILEIRRQRKN